MAAYVIVAVDVDYRDADVLFSSDVAREFIDLDDPNAKPQWVYTPVPEKILSVEKVSADDVEVGQIVAITGSTDGVKERIAARQAQDSDAKTLAPFMR